MTTGRALAWLAVALLSVAQGRADPSPAADDLRTAKALFFDGSYAEARRAWEMVRASAAPEARDAQFWIARCSENLGELQRALDEYRRYVEAKPANAALAAEARTARAGLALKLVKAGQRQHLALLRATLEDPSRSVRYFAALQLSQLGPRDGAPAIPVLREILAQEKDPDLVDRAKLALVRLDPKALRPPLAEPAAPPARPPARTITWIKVRIFEKGHNQPTVSINLPIGLADLVFKSLPEEARDTLKRKGYDADNFWERLKKLGPTEIVTIQGDGGERIQIWTE